MRACRARVGGWGAECGLQLYYHDVGELINLQEPAWEGRMMVRRCLGFGAENGRLGLPPHTSRRSQRYQEWAVRATTIV